MTYFIVCVLIYAISAFAVYKFFQKAYYNKRGRWTNISPNTDDLFLTFAPVYNTVAALLFWIFLGWKDDESKEEINFFKPKDHEQENP